MLAGNIVNCDIFILCLFEDDRCDSGHLYVMWGVTGRKKKMIKSIRSASGNILERKKVKGEWNADWKEEEINQGGCFDWQHSEVFSVKVSRRALILFLLPSPFLIHHLPPWLIVVPSSAPKRLAVLSPYLALLSIVPPPCMWLLNAAPLIFLFRNLQRQRKSGLTCVIFNSCPGPSFAPATPRYSATEVGFRYLFSLCPQMRYMTRWTQAQKRQWAVTGKVQRSPREGGDAVYAGSRRIQRQHVFKIALSLMVTLTKVSVAFSGVVLLICFPKGQGVPFQSALTFFLLTFWVMSFNCLKGERELLLPDFIPEFMWFVCSR